MLLSAARRWIAPCALVIGLGACASPPGGGHAQDPRYQPAAASDAYADANRAAITLSAAFVPIIRVAILCGFMVTLVVGGHLTLNGTLRSACTRCSSS